MTHSSSELVVGLDIGSSKVCCIVGEIDENGDVSIRGVNETPAKGLRQGIVRDVALTRAAIQKALENATNMAGCNADQVIYTISGNHLRCQNTAGSISLNERMDQRSIREITPEDVERVTNSATATLTIESGEEILHVIPQEYIVDDQSGITNPVGMSGTSLKVSVHVVTGSFARLTDLQNCVRGCDLNPAKVIFQPIASAEACLTEDDKMRGVCLVDIGHGTTDIAIFVAGALIHSATLSIGGSDMTGDLATILQTSTDDAEEIKQKYGDVSLGVDWGDEEIEIPEGHGGLDASKTIRRSMICDTLSTRIRNILDKVDQELQNCKIDVATELRAGVVITGGCANTKGIAQITSAYFGIPARVGLPLGVSGLGDLTQNAKMTACVGLVLLGLKCLPSETIEPSFFEQLWENLLDWLKSHFSIGD